jgi:hypothetical protein
MDRVTPVLNLGIAVIIVEIKIPRDGLERPSDKLLRDLCDMGLRVDLYGRLGQQPSCFLILYFDTGLQQELEGFVQDTLNEIVCK